MTDMQRIEQICNLLKTYWGLFPERSLFQILKSAEILDDGLYMDDQIVYNLLSNAILSMTISPYYQNKIAKIEKELGIRFEGHNNIDAKHWITKYEDMYYL